MSAKQRLRLGIYGGTFDPVHLGHLILANDALEQFKLDAVLFVPARQSPFKSCQPGARDAQRLAMLRLALKGREKFWLSRCELDRPAPSYALDTAQEIGEAFPRAELFWLIGADQLPDLGKWHCAKELRKIVTFALLPRSGEARGKKGRRGSKLAAAPPNRYICHRNSSPREIPSADRPPYSRPGRGLYCATSSLPRLAFCHGKKEVSRRA